MAFTFDDFLNLNKYGVKTGQAEASSTSSPAEQKASQAVAKLRTASDYDQEVYHFQYFLSHKEFLSNVRLNVCDIMEYFIEVHEKGRDDQIRKRYSDDNLAREEDGNGDITADFLLHKRVFEYFVAEHLMDTVNIPADRHEKVIKQILHMAHISRDFKNLLIETVNLEVFLALLTSNMGSDRNTAFLMASLLGYKKWVECYNVPECRGYLDLIFNLLMNSPSSNDEYINFKLYAWIEVFSYLKYEVVAGKNVMVSPATLHPATTEFYLHIEPDSNLVFELRSTTNGLGLSHYMSHLSPVTELTLDRKLSEILFPDAVTLKSVRKIINQSLIGKYKWMLTEEDIGNTKLNDGSFSTFKSTPHLMFSLAYKTAKGFFRNAEVESVMYSDPTIAQYWTAIQMKAIDKNSVKGLVDEDVNILYLLTTRADFTAYILKYAFFHDEVVVFPYNHKKYIFNELKKDINLPRHKRKSLADILENFLHSRSYRHLEQ